MSGFATIEGRRSPAEQSVNILVSEHLNTEEKRKQAIAVNKLEIERLKSGMQELRSAVQDMAEDFDQRLNMLERVIFLNSQQGRDGHGRQSPSGGGKRKKKKKRTRRKKKRN